MPGLPSTDFDDRVADRLHEAVDQRGGEVGTGGGVDAAGRNETVFLCPEELGSQCARFFSSSLAASARQRRAATDVMDARFLALGVFFDQDSTEISCSGSGPTSGASGTFDNDICLATVLMVSSCFWCMRKVIACYLLTERMD